MAEDYENEIDEAEEVEDGEEESAPAPLVIDPDSANIIPDLLANPEGKEWLSKLVQTAAEKLNSAAGAMAKAKEDRARTWKTILELDKAPGPWEGASDAKSYLALERVHRLTARFFNEIFVQNSRLFNVEGAAETPEEQALNRIREEHLNHQFRNQINSYESMMYRAIMEFVAVGTVFSRSAYDIRTGEYSHYFLTLDDLILPYVKTAVKEDLSDMPWVGEILRYHEPDVRMRAESGEFADVEAVLRRNPSHDDEPIPEAGQDSNINQLLGICKSDADKASAPYILIEYSGTEKLPDGSYQPISLIFDPFTMTAVRCYVRDMPDPEDLSRLQAQEEEFEMYQAALGEYQEAVMQYEQAFAEWQQRSAMGEMLPQPEFTMEPPPPPSWLEDGMEGPEDVSRVPIHMYARADFLATPDTFLGVGAGKVCGELQKTANRAINNFQNAAEFGNSSMLVTSSDVKFEGKQKFGPGVHIRIPQIAPEQVKNAFHELRATNANPQLLDIARMQGDFADMAIASPAVLSGESGKSGEAASGIIFRGEQASKQLTAPGMALLRFMTRHVKNQAILNFSFMDDTEAYYVAGERKEVERHIYAPSFSVRFTADVRFVGQAQRVAEAERVLQMIAQMPPLQSSPALIHRAATNYFVAMGKPELAEMLGAAPPAPEVFGAPPEQPQGQVQMPPNPGVPPQPGDVPPEA